MTVQFKRATKHAARLRLALGGPAGSGKTFTMLSLAAALGQRVAVLDTEHGSASKYSDRFEFDVIELESFHPERYVEGIHAAEDAGYDVLGIDSLSHAWMGKDGALELVDRAAKRSQSSNSFAAWRDVTPLHNQMVEAMIGSKLHLIVTVRSKTEYVLETNERGRQVPRKVGMAPVQRDGLEYEFDVYGEMDQDNSLIVTKSRCPALSGAVIPKPGAAMAATLREWLSGAPVPAPSEPMVDSVDHKLYQRYAKLCIAAAALDVPYQLVKLPISEQQIKEWGTELVAAVKLAEAEKEAASV